MTKNRVNKNAREQAFLLTLSPQQTEAGLLCHDP